METFALTIFGFICVEYGIRVIKLITDTPLAVATPSTQLLDTVVGVAFVVWGTLVLF